MVRTPPHASSNLTTMRLLQLALVVHNVWDTYKILKRPQRPSQRALASRKRAMKSALAVWIVWAAFWLLEPTLDATLGLLMPFYSQAKSFLALGLLVFRSYVRAVRVVKLCDVADERCRLQNQSCCTLYDLR